MNLTYIPAINVNYFVNYNSGIRITVIYKNKKYFYFASINFDIKKFFYQVKYMNVFIDRITIVSETDIITFHLEFLSKEDEKLIESQEIKKLKNLEKLRQAEIQREIDELKEIKKLKNLEKLRQAEIQREIDELKELKEILRQCRNNIICKVCDKIFIEGIFDCPYCGKSVCDICIGKCHKINSKKEFIIGKNAVFFAIESGFLCCGPYPAKILECRNPPRGTDSK